MKKLLIIATLILIALCVHGQTVTNYPQAEFFSAKLDYQLIKSATPNTKLLVFFPGSGEMGTGDGSLLSLTDRYSFPKFASQGTNYQFDILIIQPNKSYAGIEGNFLAWVEEEFHPSSIIVAGISLGAIQVNKLLYLDKYKHITAFVAMSGKGFPAELDRMNGIPGYVYHGQKDATVTYIDAMKFYTPYQAKFNNLTFDISPNAGHNGWDTASNDKMLAWIIDHFGPEPQPTATYDEVYNKVVEDIIAKLKL